MTGSRIEHTDARRSASKPASRCSRCAVPAAPANSRTSALRLHAGEVLGVIGLLGAGRTELALALFGMTPLDRGEMLLEGNAGAAALEPGRRRARHRLCFRGSAVARPQPAAVDRRQHLDHRARPAGRTGSGLVSPGARSGLAAELGATGSTSRRPRRRRRGANAVRRQSAARRPRKWLATKPKVLILDSPTVGVDIRNKQGIYEIIRAARRATASPSS